MVEDAGGARHPTLRWPVVGAVGGVRLAWRDGPTLGGRFRRAGEFRAVYSPRTRENHPHRRGRYCLLLARAWRASSLPVGPYAREVEVADTAGNRQVARLPFTVTAARGAG